MRLTLRTLLAYLDDTLEPTQAKVIGQKVAESEVAQQLIERIKQVTRRRRLMVPPATGPGAKVDPNTVAEYLDNTLPTDKLAEVEEICLTSDVHLAEIAACHQILTLVLGEPTRVPPTAKQRMYGLVKGRESIPYRKPMATPKPERMVRPARAVDETDDSMLLGLPAYGRQSPLLRLLAPLVGVLALVIGLAVVVWMAMPRSDSRRYAYAPGTTADRSPTEKDPTERVRTEKGPTTKVPNDPGPPDPATKNGKTPDQGTNEKPPIKPVPPEPMGTPIEQEPVVEKPSKERREVGRYLPSSGNLRTVLLQQQPDPNQWQRLTPTKDRIATNEYLVSLPGYKSELRLDNDVGLTLWGNLPELSSIPVLESAVMLHAPAKGVDLDFTLHRGRVVIANHRPDKDASVRVRFFDEMWELTLEPRAEAALELWSRFPAGMPSKQGDREKPESIVGLFVKGQVQFRNRFLEFRMPNPGLYVWQSYRASAANEPQGIEQLPPWWLGQNSGKPQDIRDILTALDELNTKLKKDDHVDVVLTELAQKSKSQTTRTLAVFSLGATDDLTHLVEALMNDTRRDVREVAILGLRHWISLKPDNDQKLMAVLFSKDGAQASKGFTENEAEIIMSLLHSFSDDERANPLTYEALILYLLHPKLAIRELAYWHLVRMVPEGKMPIPYNPAGDEAQRQKAYELWKIKVPDGKVPMRPEEKP